MQDRWMVSWKGRPPHTCCTTTRGRRELTKPNPLPVSDDEDEIDRKEAGEAQGGSELDQSKFFTSQQGMSHIMRDGPGWPLHDCEMV